jgi:hypothetical protein
MNKVAISFVSRDTDARLIASGGRILTSLTGNPHYPAPKPALATVQAALDAFAAAVAGLDRSSASIAVRDKARLPLKQLLRELSLYVQQASQGDREILLGSGYPLQKGRQPAVKPDTPHNLRLRQGNSGQIVARCNAEPSALSYQWRYATGQAPAVYSQQEPSTKATTTLVGLVPGTLYSVQVRAVGTRGVSDWSDAAVLVVN